MMGKMVRIGVLGATGYTGLELIKILLRHPQAELVALTSRQEGSVPVAEIHPQLTGRIDLALENLSPGAVAERADCVFSCLPHGASAQAVGQILDAGKRVIDFSADYRLKDPQVYQQWYKQQHVDPARLETAVYGLPEFFAGEIREANLVANPGCYPTGAALAVAPLVAGELVSADDMIFDSKSGVSGAGRTPKLTTLFTECNESIAAYAVGEHRHTPEIDQNLSRIAGRKVEVIFTPHLVPMDRGILTTVYASLTGDASTGQLLDALRGFYEGKPFVRVVDHLPSTKHTMGTNDCDITGRRVGNRAVVVSSEDNLIKGASGQAVQNFNLMYGFAETLGLI